MNKELHDLSLQVIVVREKALLVTEGLLDKHGRQINHWLPRSQIQTDGEPEEGKICTITVPQWLVEERGLTVD